MMLDCGLSVETVLRFLPLSFVPSSRLLNLANWMPADGADPELEGVQQKIKNMLYFNDNVIVGIERMLRSSFHRFTP